MSGRIEDLPEDPEIVSKFEKLDFVSLWKGREKVDLLEKSILSHFLSSVDARRILEVGPGNGRLTGIVRRFTQEYVATDINKSFLEEVREKFSRTNSLYVASNLYHLPFADNAFSSVVMVRVFNFMSRPLSVLEEMSRVIGPGGYLIISISPKPSLATLIDDLKYRSYPDIPGDAKRDSITFSNLDIAPVHPASYPTFAFKRSFIRKLFEKVGFNEIARISSGLEDYSVLRFVPVRGLFNIGIIFRIVPVFPTTFFLLQKNNNAKDLLRTFNDVLQCPSCRSKLKISSGTDEIVCGKCGFAGSLKDGITDLTFVPRDAKLANDEEWKGIN